MRPLWIVVEDGDIFEGHQGHWADSFFSNATRAAIQGFLDEPGTIHHGTCKYVIREMTDEELSKHPEAIEFAEWLIQEYGEL